MKMEFPIEKTVKQRYSVRTYDNHTLSTKEKDQIKAYMKSLTNPFSIDISFQLLEKETSANGEKLGTYGVIKGAVDFIGASVVRGDLALEALGYSFEKLVLYLTSLGLGTCWLGGTFNRSSFASAMNLKEGELFPCISPIGYPISKKRLLDSFMRLAAKSDQRKEWKDLYFIENVSKPLSQSDAGEYAFPLEMLRLAPSAVNKQPWRVMKDKDSFHFFKNGALKTNGERIDIQKVDMGIAACHFHLAALEKDLPGTFKKLEHPGIDNPDHMEYEFSWVTE